MNTIKYFLILSFLLITSVSFAQHYHSNSESSTMSMPKTEKLPPSVALERFQSFAKSIQVENIRNLPVHSHGRIKPFETYARETVLYIAGKYKFEGMDPIQFYLATMISNVSSQVAFINIRDVSLREKLGFSKADRWFSLDQIDQTDLESIVKPIVEKQRQNDKLVTPDEKKVLEVAQQTYLVRSVQSGEHFFQSLLFENPNQGGHSEKPASIEKAQLYLKAVASQDASAASIAASSLIEAQKSQKMPELFKEKVSHMDIEVFYNHAHLFFLAGLLYLLIGVIVLGKFAQSKLTTNKILALTCLPLLLHISGFAIRVYITGFAPVTNMYGTMIWMAFGVILFSAVLYKIYKNNILFGILLLGAAATLILTENIPLILSPDMDPIVAVLRNNFWLTIHVLTITISYAAFSISMLIGNTAMIRSIIKSDYDSKFYSDFGHICYRSIQLGVFFLTTGIILGGWWADYSWGRFWGWDPKETWALIADLGFLAIQHAKYLGWLKPFGLLAAAPIAYILVIMAWYGVNFILAAGLHSYGFSSGGATIVVSFVLIQLTIFAVAMIKYKTHKKN